MGDGYCLSNNSKDGLNREYSYPSIIQGSDGLIHGLILIPAEDKIYSLQYSLGRKGEPATLSEARALL